MAADPAKVRDEALSLPAEARARLAADLLRSLDDDDELDPAAHEAAWADEIAERLRAVDAGEVKPVPWAEARDRIARED
jgi:putative addiction module component (TIGR02574 family)